MHIHRSVLVASVVFASSAALARAQTPVSLTIAPDVQGQMQTFDSALRAAIAKAAGQLGVRARQVAPNIRLQFESDARITGIVLPDGEGIQFFVDVPGILPDAVVQWQMQRMLLKGMPVSTTGNTGASVPRPAPSAAGPDDSVLMTDPEKEYSSFAHDALVDTILDSGFNLPLKEGQSLTLVVGDGQSGLPQNPLVEKAKLLFLRIKADDLVALRQNKITRDEAKKRIRQWVY